MSIRPFVFRAFSVVLMTLGAGVASGQGYPTEPIRIFCGASGSNSNLVSRLVAEEISGPLGQPVVVDGRGGLLSIESVLKARPDGHTLLLYGSVVWIEPLLRKTNWDPLRDFAPVTTATITPNVITVHPSLPVKSVKQLIALAKARPGELNYGSASAGATSHLGAELFKSMAGVNIVGVKYRGNGLAIIDLIGGHIEMVFIAVASVAPHIKSGRLRGLAVASAKPSRLLPDLPTVTASGLPGYVSESQLGILAPAKTPATIINRLNREIVRFLQTAKAQEQFSRMGSEAAGSSPQEFESTIRCEVAKLGKVIKDAGIRAD